MNNNRLEKLISELAGLDTSAMTKKDFLLSWEQSDDEICSSIKNS